MLAAAAVVLIPQVPLGLLTTAVQALAGILLPSATVFLLLLCNDREVLGPLVNPRWLNVLAATVIGALLGLSALLTATTIVPRLPLTPAVTGLAVAIAVLAAGATLIAIRARPAPAPAPADRRTWTMPPIESLRPGPLALAHARPGRPALLPARRDHRAGRAGHPARAGRRLARRTGTVAGSPGSRNHRPFG